MYELEEKSVTPSKTEGRRSSVRFADQEDSPSRCHVIGRESRSSTRSPVSSHGSRSPHHGLSKHITSWLSDGSLRYLQEKIDFESSSVKNMYTCLLENEKSLQEEIDGVLQKHEELNSRRKMLLYKKWHEKTYAPLAKEIDHGMNCGNYQSLDRRKREVYDDYLKHRNKKGHVFLDVISRDEYDPMCLNDERPGPLTARVGKLEDPLLHLQQKRNDEDRVNLQCDHARSFSDSAIERMRLPKLPLVPLGRHGTQCNTWQNMKFKHIQSDVRERSQEKMYGIRNKSNICLATVRQPVTPDVEMFDRKSKWRKRRQFPNQAKATEILFV